MFTGRLLHSEGDERGKTGTRDILQKDPNTKVGGGGEWGVDGKRREGVSGGDSGETGERMTETIIAIFIIITMTNIILPIRRTCINQHRK